VKVVVPTSIREPLYATDSPKQTVSLTINSDLYARIKAQGINASKVAERALADELDRQRRAALMAEIAMDISATDAYIEKHGSFADLVRHYGFTPVT
jgi:antitoxin CcdA